MLRVLSLDDDVGCWVWCRCGRVVDSLCQGANLKNPCCAALRLKTALVQTQTTIIRFKIHPESDRVLEHY